MKTLFKTLILLNILTLLGSFVWIFFDWTNLVPYIVYLVSSIGVFINFYYYSKYLHR